VYKHNILKRGMCIIELNFPKSWGEKKGTINLIIASDIKLLVDYFSKGDTVMW